MILAALALALTLSSLAAQADAPVLIGPTWVAVELAGMPVPSQPAARRPTLEFVANGRVAGRDGCNRFSGPYRRDGERLTVGPLAVTRMACPGADDVTRRFDGALKGTSRFRIAAGRLELYGATGKPLAIFTASDEAPPAAAAPAKERMKS